jgi:hypothetical protein
MDQSSLQKMGAQELYTTNMQNDIMTVAKITSLSELLSVFGTGEQSSHGLLMSRGA